MNQQVISDLEQWIGSLSTDLKNEAYEMNEFTISYLQHLCQLNKKKDSHIENMRNDNLEKSEEYSTEADRIYKKFMLLGIEEKDFNQNPLTDIADIGNSLGVTHPSHENYLLNLSELSMEESELKSSMKKQDLLLQQLSNMLEKLDNTIRKLSEEINSSANKNEMGELDVPVEIEKAKAQAQHYVESTKEFKKLLTASGVKKEYTHEGLMNLSNKVTALTADIQSVEEKLAQFKQLPPSLPLAQEKIRQIKEEIGTLEQTFPELRLCS